MTTSFVLFYCKNMQNKKDSMSAESNWGWFSSQQYHHCACFKSGSRWDIWSGNESYSLKFSPVILRTCSSYFAIIQKQWTLALNSPITSACQGKIPESQPCLYLCETNRRQASMWPRHWSGSAPASRQPWEKDAGTGRTTFSEPTGWSCNSAAQRLTPPPPHPPPSTSKDRSSG